jgi:molecular chaperone DnaK
MKCIDVGIDLGESSAVIATAAGDRFEVVKNRQSTSTPSLVYVDRRGGSRVGYAASDMMLCGNTATDVHSQFRRLIGKRIELEFKSAGKKLTPEELSGEVLAELRRAYSVRFGSELEAAVITVPAEFDDVAMACMHVAAAIAGFRHVELLDEPVAAVIAYGGYGAPAGTTWLVVQISQSRASASVVRREASGMAVIAHEVLDDFGAGELDWMIVDECMAPLLGEHFALSRLARGPNARDIDNGRMLALKHHAENIKKVLSTQEKVEYFAENVFTDDNGNAVDLECLITREQFEAIITPHVRSVVNLARAALRSPTMAGIRPAHLIAHGGGTLVPVIQRELSGLSMRFHNSIVPQAALAMGAAIHASKRLMQTPFVQRMPQAQSRATVQLEYESVTQDASPYVGGKIEIDGKPPAMGTTVSIERDDNVWNSGAMPLDPKGMFFASVQIREKGESVFSLVVRDAGGQLIPCKPDSLTIAHGTPSRSAPLPVGCCFGLADGSAVSLIKGGTRLPCPATVYKGQFVRSLRAGSDGELRIALLSGDEPIAEHNLGGSYIKIAGKDIARDIAAGEEVEIEISIDAAGVPKIQTYIPSIDETFRPQVEFEFEKPATTRQRVRAIRDRLKISGQIAVTSNLRQRAKEINALEGSDMFEEIERLLKRCDDGDQVSAGIARNLIADIAKRASTLVATVEFSTVESEHKRILETTRNLATGQGDSNLRTEFNELATRASMALRARNTDLLKHYTHRLAALMNGLLINSGRPEGIFRFQLPGVMDFRDEQLFLLIRSSTGQSADSRDANGEDTLRAIADFIAIVQRKQVRDTQPTFPSDIL